MRDYRTRGDILWHDGSVYRGEELDLWLWDDETIIAYRITEPYGADVPTPDAEPLPPHVVAALGSDPYPLLDWREVDGEQVAVVPCWGKRPDLLRDDDLMKLSWGGSWRHPYLFFAQDDYWSVPAIILRRRPETVILPTRYRLGPDGKPDMATAEIVEGEE